MKYCSKCGSEFNAGSKFCDQCGHQPENLNKENEVHAQSETTPVQVYEKTKNPVLSKSKIITIAFTLSTLTIVLTSFYFVIKSNQRAFDYDIYPTIKSDFNYEEELTSLFPYGAEQDIDPIHEYQPINYQVSIHRDDILKEIDELIELHRDRIDDYSAQDRIYYSYIIELNDAIVFGLLPLSSIMFFMSLYLFIISFKETK
tara:strand:- start:221 stop:823 length:603 start_codon:yes stop_codon:yes gene_type:complete